MACAFKRLIAPYLPFCLNLLAMKTVAMVNPYLNVALNTNEFVSRMTTFGSHFSASGKLRCSIIRRIS
uniref:Uncharacterized protein n=1 Tax=Trichuris muris TaxID=70415 RepID=A0A5S6R0Q2_TRIMR